MSLHGEHGAAWRRRQRRLRSWWRHEQQSVAMALSAAAHHSYDKVAAGAKYDGLRTQTTDRAGEAAHRAPRRQRTRAAGEAVIFELFDEDTAGGGPGFSQSPGRRNESSGTPWSTSSTSSGSRPWCRLSTLLCQRSRAPRGRNWVPSRAHGRCELSWGPFGGTTWGAASSPCC